MWAFKLLLASVALFAASNRILIVVTVVGYDARTNANEAEAAAAGSRVVDAIASLGFRVKPGQLICDDASAGAEKMHAAYYVLVSPDPNWSRMSLRLFKVGNDHPLRSVLIAKPSALAPGARMLMDSSLWANAYVRHKSC